ncbi:type II secretion system F family protein [Arcanobacterium pinnipediorum]|uniref:Type II secretion system F family protein n=1 Tax=Arcanobacterium pinnipediorum TaxID=1503041 RepID=A0ABY5AGY4_9ACTO|nr:type II secretion system F family protein [Arcanobacterium pinnipediorum]USR78956.1 type II secretion system F family protein [Arcanobacterium pinnipediorum]
MISTVILGMVCGCGVFLILIGLFTARKSLSVRILSHVATRTHRPRSRSSFERFTALIMGVIEKLGSTRASVAKRLMVLGNESVEDFRLTQLQWGGGGLIVGVLVGLSLVSRGYPPVIVIVVALLCALGGALWLDSRLSAQVKKTSQLYTRQLPDVIELIALAVSSGEPVRPAIERVVRLGSGPLIDQFATTLSHVHAGLSLSEALGELAIRTDNRNIARFTDSLISAMEQGGGLAQTLHHQARDARDASRRELLEAGGKAEISMMVPVVFLILPITVLFTIFPALHQLKFT